MKLRQSCPDDRRWKPIRHAIAKRYGPVVIADLDLTRAAHAASELDDKKTAIGIRMHVSNEEEVMRV